MTQKNYSSKRKRSPHLPLDHNYIVNTLQRIPCNLRRVSRIQSHPKGNNTADTSTNRQPIGNEVLSNKNCTSYPMECLRLRTTIQVPHHARSRFAKLCRRLPVSNVTNPKRKSSSQTARRLLNSAHLGQSIINRCRR